MVSGGLTASELSLADLEDHDPDAPSSGQSERRFRCPLDSCGGTPYRLLSVSVETGLWKCFGCEASGLLVEFRGERPAIRWKKPSGSRAVTPTVEDEVSVREALAESVSIKGTLGEAYLCRRGIPLQLAHEAGCRYAPDWYGAPAVLFPLVNGVGEVVAVTGRSINDEHSPRYRDRGPKRLGAFMTPGALEPDFVAITEGSMDALTLAACDVPAVAIMGCTVWPEWLEVKLAFREVLVATDDDEHGELAAEQLATSLRSLGARTRRLVPPEIDWNDAHAILGSSGLIEWLNKQSVPARDVYDLGELEKGL